MFDYSFFNQIYSALEKWQENGRWNNIWLAGVRDDDPDTIFDKIIAGEIPASIVKNDKDVLAFKVSPSIPHQI